MYNTKPYNTVPVSIFYVYALCVQNVMLHKYNDL